jgi:protein SCO1/2
MAKARNVSLTHAVIAMGMMAVLASFPLWFYQPKPKDDPLANLPDQPNVNYQIPLELRGVGITESVGAPLPLNLIFNDENGNQVTLGSYFQSGKPVILTLNYSDCPMLCHVQLNKFVECMNEGKIFPGNDFTIVTVSINPHEAAGKAKAAKQNYQRDLEGDASRWHFLTTAQEENIKTLARIVGFNYKFDPVRKDYAHSSALIFCTPQGAVSQYYQGIDYKPGELKQRIADAGAGKQYASEAIDNPFNCKLYDGSKPYALAASRAMKIICTICAVALLLVLSVLWMLPEKQPVVLPPLQGEK